MHPPALVAPCATARAVAPTIGCAAIGKCAITSAPIDSASATSTSRRRAVRRRRRARRPRCPRAGCPAITGLPDVAAQGRPRREHAVRERAGSPARSRRRAARPAPSSCEWTRFIAGEPMKPATKTLTGWSYSALRDVDLLELAVAHDRHAVAHRHRLGLVVRDVERRRLRAAGGASPGTRASRRAASRRGSRAARPSGTRPARGRSRGPSRRAAAGRRRAGRASA